MSNIDPTGHRALTNVLIAVAIIAVLANIALTVIQGIRQQVSWLEIGRRVFMNLAVFALIAGAIFATGAMAVVAGVVLIGLMVWGLVSLVTNWPNMTTEDKVFTVLIMLTYIAFGQALSTAAALNTPPSKPLDWSIKSKAGETRPQHVNTHGANNTAKPLHGVFRGDPVTEVNATWAAKGGAKPTFTKGGLDHYILPRKGVGWEGGLKGSGKPLHHVHIITKQGTSSIITGYPVRGPVQATGAALLPQAPPSSDY